MNVSYFLLIIINNNFNNIIGNSNKSRHIFEEDLNKVIRRFTHKKTDNKVENGIENTNNLLRKLLRIIDNGLDKSHDEFLQDLNNIMTPIRESTTKKDHSIPISIDNKPITSCRNYLDPKFELTKLIINPNHDNGYPESIHIPKDELEFNLWELYTKSFKNVYKKYFSHLSDNESDSKELKEKKFDMRHELYNNYKIKLCLIEDSSIMCHFLKQIWYFHQKVKELIDLKSVNRSEIQEELNFWKMFHHNILDLEPNYVVYLLPYNPQDGKNVNPHLYYTSMISEHLANQDHIYQTLIFNTWMVHKNSFDTSKHKGKIDI